jgi:hypothetical protein
MNHSEPFTDQLSLDLALEKTLPPMSDERYLVIIVSDQSKSSKWAILRVRNICRFCVFTGQRVNDRRGNRQNIKSIPSLRNMIMFVTQSPQSLIMPINDITFSVVTRTFSSENTITETILSIA